MNARILIDFTATKSIHNGLGQFSIGLGNALIAAKPEDFKIDVLIPKGKEYLFPNADGFRFKNSFFIDKVPRLLKQPFAKHWQYDLWHLSNQNSQFLPLDPHVPVLLTIHDLNFLRERHEADWPRKLKQIENKIKRAKKINTISNFVRQEIAQQFKLSQSTIDVIYNGGINDENLDPEPVQLQQNKPYLFSIGEFLEKKNFHVLIEMLVHLPDYQLIIAGKNTTDYAKRCLRLAQQFRVLDRVQFIGHVSNQQRHWLYQNMHAFVFPSQTEGFGLPIIEAMNYLKPVFCAHLTSLPEIGQSFAYYWHDFEAESMAQVVRDGLQHFDQHPQHAIAAQTHAQTFNWHQAAQRYLKLYEQILG